MSDSRETHRAQVENLLSLLASTDLSLRLIEIRSQQLLLRTGQCRLINPIFEEVNTLRISISKVRGILAEEWDAGERAGWGH